MDLKMLIIMPMVLLCVLFAVSIHLNITLLSPPRIGNSD